MFALILYLPLINWLLGFLFGRWLSSKGTSLIIVSSMFFTTILSWYSFYFVCFRQIGARIKGQTMQYIAYVDRDWIWSHEFKPQTYPYYYELQWWNQHMPYPGDILAANAQAKNKLYWGIRDMFSSITEKHFSTYWEYVDAFPINQYWLDLWDKAMAGYKAELRENPFGYRLQIVFHKYDSIGDLVHYKLCNWINIEGLNVAYGLIFDVPTVSMLVLVTTVSFCVHLFSLDYMGGDPHLPRFLSYLSLFTFFMIILVTADNILQLFIGWEGVGVCSYLLINFWFTRIQANKAAIKAMIMNRIGDMGLILAMFFIYDFFGTFNFYEIFQIIDTMFYYLKGENCVDIFKWYTFFNYNISPFEIIALLLLIGAIGKSAQIGLHTWLPDAMEGPTPVSALIHAATMVTAGVFLLIRCSPILEHAPITLSIITIIGACTAFLAATIGAFQYDIKKVIAYSTCSQLGYMVFTCGLSAYSTSLFHLLNHGFFKALLFLSAGNIIHAMADEQDMRKLGGLIKSLPITYSFMLIGSLSLMGFPYLTGYYSKDTIIELTQNPLTSTAWFAYWLGVYSAFFTAFYSLRLIYYTFIVQPNCNIKTFKNSHDVNIIPIVALSILTFFSIFFGYIFKDAYIGLGSDFLSNSIPFTDLSRYSVEWEFLSFFEKNVPVFISLTGAFLAIIINNNYNYIFTKYQIKNLSNIFTFFNNKWHFDMIYNNLITKKFLNISHEVTFKTLDKGIFELFGPLGISSFIKNASKNISLLQSGVLYHYVLIIVIFIFAILYVSQINLIPLDYITFGVVIIFWLFLNKK